ncbi:OmpA family protein [Sphingobium estronivorans]|uniref:OmpA family protein n=1 Tax=Sphingobium estronivorans TaxID=1577690 RepID=UPI0012397AF4|nr:OmpA family protein [Sphingobium estronivorans]
MLALASHSRLVWRLGGLVLALAAAQARAEEPAFMPDIAPLSDFPDPSHATRREGLFLPPGMPRLLMPGMTKRQAYALLGAPHFHEGLFGERRWDYILNFHTGSGTAYRICRLQLRWDRRMRLDRMAWSSEDCRAAVYPIIPERRDTAVPPLPVPAPAPDPAPLTLYFDFDKADLDQKAYQDLARFVAANSNRDAKLSIIGYTDGAGPDAYNDRLSLMRADMVAKSLVALGMRLSNLQISGAGERSPARPGEADVRDPLNRRVQVAFLNGG